MCNGKLVFQPVSSADVAGAMSRIIKLHECNPYCQVEDKLGSGGFPTVLMIGASHVARWSSYKASDRTDELDKEVLANYRFVGVVEQNWSL